jgi:hypothetical protein
MSVQSGEPLVEGGDYASFMAELRSGASRLCHDFKLGSEAEERLCNYMAFVAARRFKLPFAAGGEAALGRLKGRALRAEVSGEYASARILLELESSTCPQVMFLETIDRCGMPHGLFAIIEAMSDSNELIHVGQFPERTEPVQEKDIAVFVREPLLALFHELTGTVPSKKRDFKRKKGKLVVVSGSPADFLAQALALCGWHFTVAQLAKLYFLTGPDGGVLKARSAASCSGIFWTPGASCTAMPSLPPS